MKGLLLDVDYAEEEEQPRIRLFIKGESGPVMAVDPSFEQYLYTTVSDPQKVVKLMSKLELTENGHTVKPKSVEVVERKLLSRDVATIKVSFHHPRDMAPLRHAMRELPGVKEIYEFDMPSARRYLVDRGLTPLTGVEAIGKVEELSGLKTVLVESHPKSASVPEPKLNVMSFDIEVYNPTGTPRPEKDPILMVSLSDNRGLRKVITWKDMNVKLDYVEVVGSEREMLKRFVELVADRDIDILLGYNTDLFDFPYIRERARQLKLELGLGRDGSEVITRKRRFATAARIRGRVHVDVFSMVNFLATIGTMRLIHYTLEDVYRHVIGKGKLDFEFTDMVKAWEGRGELGRKLLEYSMSDADATLELGLELLPLFIELTRVVGQTLFDVSRMTPGQLVEWLLIAEAHKRGELVPARPVGDEFEERLDDTYTGAYVVEPVKGLHEDLVVYDFRSLYPSIIVTHNIDPSTINCDCCKPDEATMVPELGYRFCKKRKGFIPATLERIIEARTKLKEEMKHHDIGTREYRSLDARQWALKIVANSFYGMMGYPRARWYFKQCAESVTSFGRYYIHKTIKMADDFGLEVIYGDSVRGDTPVLVRRNGRVECIPIEDLIPTPENRGYSRWKLKNVEIWTEEGRKSVHYVYQHKVKKRIYRVLTRKGFIEVTEDHSFIINGEPRSPKGLKVGDKLTLVPPPRLDEQLHIDEDFAWLVGFFLAEGSCGAYRCPSGTKYSWKIDNTQLRLLEKAKRALEKFGFGAKILDIRESSNVYRLVPMGNHKALSGLFSDWCMSKLGRKRVPQFILSATEKAKRKFLDGYLAGDGSIDRRQGNITFTSIDKCLFQGILLILDSLGRDYTLKFRKDKNALSAYVILDKTDKRIAPLDRIKRIENFETWEYVYDVETENHHFVGGVGNILLHNTDSLHCKLNGKSKKDAMSFLKQVNDSLPGIMELELEGFYPRGVFVTKKRYAMIDEKGRMIVKGLEFVRRDWAAIAKRTQEEVLKAILKDGSPKKAAEIIRKTTRDVLEGRVSLDDLVIYTQLKMPIESYRAIGPHVVAAKRLRKLGHEIEPGMMIAYIEAKGSGSISDRAVPVEDFKGKEYDAEYYVGHQVLPAVMRIMEVLGYKEEDLRFERQKQVGLEKFMGRA